jgi:hypothetical protein
MIAFSIFGWLLALITLIGATVFFWRGQKIAGFAFSIVFIVVLASTAEKRIVLESAMACPRFRRHRVKVFNGAGGRPWRGVGSSHVSSSLRQFG